MQRFAYILQVHESMDTWNSIFFVLLVLVIPNYKIPRCWAVSKEKVKREKEREEGMWETIWKYDTCSKALYSVLSEE